MKKTILYGLTAAVFFSTPAFAQEKGATGEEIEATKETIAQYVETRQKIAKDKNEWKAYQEITERRIRLYEREKEQLQTQIEEARQTTSSAEQKIAGIRAEIDALRGATAIVERALPEYESRLLALAPYLPKPLRSKLDGLIANLGKSRRASDRMAVVVGLLNEIDKFNADYSHVKEERQLSNGDIILVDVLYVGLGMAYFVDEFGEIGGFGVPGKGEWTWTDRNDIAPQIRASIDYYLGENKPAQFVTLPARATDVKAGAQ